MTINTKTVENIIDNVKMIHANTGRAGLAMASVTEVLQVMQPADAALTVKTVMEQAILRGLCAVVKNADGSRNDKASNWKRDLSRAFNKAHESKVTRLSLRTQGKGDTRTVTIEYTAITATTDEDAIKAKVEKLCAMVGATTPETESMTAKFLKLYAKEQDRQAANKQAAEKAIMDERNRESAKLLAQATTIADLQGLDHAAIPGIVAGLMAANA